MSDREGFFRAIGQAPADDAPRLVYADWLEEHGDQDRAEFIRLQCEVSRQEQLPTGALLKRVRRVYDRHPGRRQATHRWLAEFMGECVADPDWWESTYRVVCRMTGLYEANADRWAAELPSIAGVKYLSALDNYVRGFLGHVWVRRGYADTSANARRLFHSMPVLGLGIVGNPRIRRLIGHPGAANIPQVVLVRPHPQAFRVVAESQEWRGLNHLRLETLGTDSIHSLVPYLIGMAAPAMSSLSVEGVNLESDRAAAFADWVGRRCWRGFSWCSGHLPTSVLSSLLGAVRFSQELRWN